MADPEHLKLVDDGRSAVERWHKGRTDGRMLDLSGADLSGRDLSRFNLFRANLTGANLSGAEITSTNFTQAILEGADLSQVTVAEVPRGAAKSTVAPSFSSATLTDARFVGASLAGAAFDNVKGEGATFKGADLRYANFSIATTSHVNFDECDLSHADFSNAIIQGATFEHARLQRSKLGGAKASAANLSGAILEHAVLTAADFSEARIDGADFYEALTDAVTFEGTKGAPSAINLETARFNHGRGAKYFDRCERSFVDRHADWEHLRTYGNLKLFGVSYTLLIFLVTLFYVVGRYNEKVEVARGWAGAVTANPDAGFSERTLAGQVNERLRIYSIDVSSVVLLFGTITLVIASFVFTFGCPDEIKDYSRSQWCYQLNNHLLHYWAVAWRHRPWRITCFTLYLLGGIPVVLVSLWKLAWAVVYVWRYVNV